MKISSHITALLLAAILLLALGIRLSVAGEAGYEFDVGTNKGWAQSAVEIGIAKSYSEQSDNNMLPDYPPLSLLVFAATGHVQTIVGEGVEPSTLLIKLPAIVADLLTIVILAFLCIRLIGRRAGIVAAAVYAINPAVWYDSAVWGQTDALFTLFAVAALGALALEIPELCAALITLCVLTKIQGILFLPLLALVFLRAPWRKTLSSVGASAVALLAVLSPFATDGALLKIRDVYMNAVGHYPTLTFGAYNFWWSLFGDPGWGKQDSDLLFGSVTYLNASMVLCLAIYAGLLWTLRKPLLRAAHPKDRFHAIFLGGMLAAQTFFLFSAEMHERYLFPYLAVGLPSIFLGAGPATLYILGSLFFWGNLLGILPFGSIDRALFAEFPAFDVFIACGQVTVFILGWVWTAGWARRVRTDPKRGKFGIAELLKLLRRRRTNPVSAR